MEYGKRQRLLTKAEQCLLKEGLSGHNSGVLDAEVTLQRSFSRYYDVKRANREALHVRIGFVEEAKHVISALNALGRHRETLCSSVCTRTHCHPAVPQSSRQSVRRKVSFCERAGALDPVRHAIAGVVASARGWRP